MKARPFASTRGKCPICGRPSVADSRPFCSRRCADVDLARWLGGVYVIPNRGEGEQRPADGKAEEDGEAGPGSETGSDPSR